MTEDKQLIILIFTTLIFTVFYIINLIRDSNHIKSYQYTILSVLLTNFILIVTYFDDGGLFFVGVEKAMTLSTVVIFRNLYIDYFSRFHENTKTSVNGTLVRVIPYILAFVMLVDYIRVFIGGMDTAYIGAFHMNIVMAMLFVNYYVVVLMVIKNIKFYLESVERFKQVFLSNIFICLLYISSLSFIISSGNLEKYVLMSGVTYALFVMALIVHSPLDSALPKNQISVEHENSEVERQVVKSKDRRTLDSLTGLYKREYFIRQLSTMDVNDGTLALIIINVTGLKLINESFGYDIGDEILQDIAVVLSETFVDSMIARMSGSQFAILQFGLNEDGINDYLMKVHKKYEKKENFRINLHTGYYMRKKSGLSPYDVFKRAEEVLYYNKLLKEQRHQNEHAEILYDNFGRILPALSNHLKRCSEQAEGFCEYLKLSDDLKRDIVNAALIHDIALTFVPNIVEYNVEFKDDFEKRSYKNHVSKGFDIAIESGMNSRVAKAIRHHHENHNGTGYPDHLTGDHIPMESQIIAIVDFVDMVIHYSNQVDDLEKILKSKIGIEFSEELVYNMVAYLKSTFIIKDTKKETEC